MSLGYSGVPPRQFGLMNSPWLGDPDWAEFIAAMGDCGSSDQRLIVAGSSGGVQPFLPSAFGPFVGDFSVP